MKKTVSLGIILVVLLACVGAVSAVTVQNFGFEAPVLPDGVTWDIFPNGYSGLDWDVQWANDPLTFLDSGSILRTRPEPANAEIQKSGLLTSTFNAYQGNQYAELDTDWDGPINTFSGEPANVTMSQFVNTINGATYHITYAQACRDADNHVPCQIRYSCGATSGVTSVTPKNTWELQSFDCTATGPSTKISFTGEEAADSFGALIDDVVMEETSRPPAVPEFPTMALPAAFIVGLIGAVLFIKSTKEN